MVFEEKSWGLYVERKTGCCVFCVTNDARTKMVPSSMSYREWGSNKLAVEFKVKLCERVRKEENLPKFLTSRKGGQR